MTIPIVIIAIVGLLGFLGYDYYQNYIISTDTSDFVDNFQGEVVEESKENDNESQNEIADIGENPLDQIQDADKTTTSSSTAGKKPTYKGFGVEGTIEIPKINLKYPILEKVTKKSIETAVAFLYGVGINEPGNNVIIGHNYRNGLFFSNLKKLEVGDKIYVTDNNGNKLTYTIYNKFEATPEDTSFYQRDTGGKPEITLSTCTDDSSARTIICAKAE